MKVDFCYVVLTVKKVWVKALSEYALQSLFNLASMIYISRPTIKRDAKDLYIKIILKRTKWMFCRLVLGWVELLVLDRIFQGVGRLSDIFGSSRLIWGFWLEMRKLGVTWIEVNHVTMKKCYHLWLSLYLRRLINFSHLQTFVWDLLD